MATDDDISMQAPDPDELTLRRDVDLLYEIGTLRQVARAWVQFGNDRQLANVAEHTLRVIWLSLVLAKHEDADAARVVQIALVHDLAETRTGDVNYVSRMYVDRNETQAMRDSLNGTVLEGEALELWDEYKAQESLEAQIVKDADNLDCDLELVESTARGHELQETLAETRQSVRVQLRTETGRRLFTRIYESDPHTWHRDTRNRLTAGDWAEPTTRSSSVSG
ncbi:MAG TPA: HD domain-containing protein [Solirubrobacterales bacterium]